MSSSEKQKIEHKNVRDKFKMSESDCGSSLVQVAQVNLLQKIKHLACYCSSQKAGEDCTTSGRHDFLLALSFIGGWWWWWRRHYNFLLPINYRHKWWCWQVK